MSTPCPTNSTHSEMGNSATKSRPFPVTFSCDWFEERTPFPSLLSFYIIIPPSLLTLLTLSSLSLPHFLTISSLPHPHPPSPSSSSSPLPYLSFKKRQLSLAFSCKVKLRHEYLVASRYCLHVCRWKISNPCST